VYAEMLGSVAGQAINVGVHGHTHVASENTAVGRVPLQSRGNIHADIFMPPEPVAPVLSSVAQQYLHSGRKPN